MFKKIKNKSWGPTSLIPKNLKLNVLYTPAWTKKRKTNNLKMWKKLKTNKNYKKLHQQGLKKRSSLKSWKNSRKTIMSDLKLSKPELYKSWYKKTCENAKKRANNPKYRKKLSKALKNSVIVKQRSLMQRNSINLGPHGIFPSRKAAAAFLKVDPSGINFRMRRYPKEYYYIKIGNAATNYKKNKRRPVY